jgi:hypothetical protein
MTKCVATPPLLASTVDGPYTSLENGNQKSAPVFFLLKKLPVTHVRQATIFAGQTVKFYRSVTGDWHLFRGLHEYITQQTPLSEFFSDWLH